MATFLDLILVLLRCGPNYCSSAECLRTANMIAENMHQTRGPDFACIDFYEYACHNFQYTHPHRDARLLDDRTAEMNQQIADLLQQEDNTAPDAIKAARATYKDCIEKANKNPSSSNQLTSQTACVEEVKNRFPRAVLRLLANEDAVANRSKVFEMTGYLKDAFTNIIEASDWLTTNVKAAAKEKISRISGVVSFRDSLISLDNLYKPVPTTFEFFGKGSVYIPNIHAVFVPITAVGFPRFNLGLPVLNFAGIGFEMAHEMGHMLDDEGRCRGVDGKHSDWWPQILENVYKNRAQCFVEQYNQFSMPDIGKNVNGQKTLEENIQDNVGLQVAFEAYLLHKADNEKEKKLKKLKHFNHKQLFTLAYANVFCQNVSPQYNEYVIRNDNHAPVRHRVNGTLMNLKEFANIWNCPPNSPMNPERKCNIWLDYDEDE